jgi:mono/diheme cytochrome c family protein
MFFEKPRLTWTFIVSLIMFSMTVNAVAAGESKQEAAQAGQEIFSQRCMQCHSVNKDQVMIGPSLYSELHNSPHKKTAAQVRVILRDGKGKMPVFKDILSQADVDHLIAYLGTL